MQKTFCERIAAECGRRAEEASDEEVREFFHRMQVNWLTVAAGVDARQSTNSRGSSPQLH